MVYIFFIPMFYLSMLLTVSRSDTPIRTLSQILLYTEDLSFTNIGTFTSIQLDLFYLLISSIVLLI